MPTLLKIHNATRDRDLGNRIIRADTRWLRLRGMMGRPEPSPGEGMLLHPCRGVHMFWMKYPLDVALLDGEGRVVALYRALAPWARSRVHRGARYALELLTGTIDGTEMEEGDMVTWEVAS